MHKTKDAVLVIYNEDPRTLCHGGNLRVHHLLVGLAESFSVTLLILTPPSKTSVSVEAVPYTIIHAPTSPILYLSKQPLATLVLYFFGALSRASKIFFRSQPLFTRHFYQIRCLRVAATALLKKKTFDYVIVEHSYLGAVLKNIQTRAVTVIDFHNVHAFSEATKYNRWIGGLIERRARRHYDIAVCCSVDDQHRLRLLGYDQVFVIPNGATVDSAVLPEQVPDAMSLLFMGDLRYPSNLEGVSFFLQHIYPLLPGAIPFHIIGYGSEALRPFSATFPSVTAHGFVPDPSVFFNNAILVCPIFNGGGTRLKVLSAFAAGVPVISTPRGVEGLGCVDGIHVLLASSARQFVDRITAILHDQQLYSAIRHAAFQFVRDQYSWERIGDGYVKMLSRFSKPSP